MARIIVCGYMIRHPLAGNILAYFHYLLGLHRLGHDVTYLEESGWPNSCYDPATRDYSDSPRAGLRIVSGLLSGYGVKAPVIYVNRESGKVEGADQESLKRILQRADLLLNVGGVCWLPEFEYCRRRALIDMDPLFTQAGMFGQEGIGKYDIYFSYGVNIGQPTCGVPSLGIEWIPTVPPVVPELWQLRANEGPSKPSASVFTTVANWSAYNTVSYGGARYGQKSEEFLRLLTLPRRTSQKLELALSGINGRDKDLLRKAGWIVRSAGEVSVNVPAYEKYIVSSRGEFSAAKNGYVKTRSGWFSDRSVCYLAAGLPVILQDTGFGGWIPTGRGIMAFSSVEEAAECIEEINSDYQAHCRAARQIAEQVFSYRVVLPRLLSAALGSCAQRGLESLL